MWRAMCPTWKWNELSSCSLTVLRVRVWKSQTLPWARPPLAQPLGSDIYLESSIFRAGDPVALVVGGRADIKDTFLEGELFQANCESRQVLTGIAGREGSQVGKSPRPAPCSSPHPLQVPCRIPSALCASRPSSGPGIQTHGGDRAAPGGYKSVHLAACGALWGLVPGCGAPERGEELQPVLPAGALIPVDQKDLTPLQRQEELLRAEN
nr:uncharacterized protein LOC106836914 isoform X1 [Equus asinus]XP_044626869.1 uncharacterized protein LOC106836914 isoform X1 [Equus asinus]